MVAPAYDVSQYTDLRRMAGNNDPAALREVAGQFEALFLQTMLKSMRDASVGDPIFGESDQFEMYQGMLDQQIALEMASGKGIGLADMLVRQLGGEPAAGSYPSSPVAGSYPGSPAASRTAVWDSPESFAKDVWPHAERVAGELGVAPEAVLAQAALETGWGQHVMAGRDGSSSFNLFGIKAGGSWNGDVVAQRTLEFEAGTPRQELARFRSYSDVATTFDDYAALLRDNPRYSNVGGQQDDVRGFGDALQQAGYATDPNYARKIEDVANSPTMERVLDSLKNSGDTPLNL